MKTICNCLLVSFLLCLCLSKIAAQITGDKTAQLTKNFTVNKSSGAVTGSGATTTNASDYFYGAVNTSYSVNISANADLFYSFNNASGASTSDLTKSNTPNGEVVAMDSGSITVNTGATVTSSPNPFGNTTNKYDQTTDCVFISESGTVYNYGTIGDMQLSGTTYPNLNNTGIVAGGYLEEDCCGIKIDGNKDTTGSGLGTSLIENYGHISGYNAFFSGGGSGLFVNHRFATVLAGNDALLTGYPTYNYPDAALQTIYSFSFACTHAYSNVTNYGYMLGQDYGILQEGNGVVVNDFGGPAAVDSNNNPILNYNGAPVYNGELSVLYRNDPVSGKPETVNPDTAYTTSTPGVDCINMDANNSTVNLISQTTADGKLWLPEMVSTICGGFDGNFTSASSNEKNTLNFQANGIDMPSAGALVQAILAAKQSNANGTYYSGTWKWTNPDSIVYTYYIRGWAGLNFTGIPNDSSNPGVFVLPAGGGPMSYYTGAKTTTPGSINTNTNDPVDGTPIESNVIATPVTMGTQTVTGTQETTGTSFICNGWTLKLGDGSTDGIVSQAPGDSIIIEGSLEEHNANPETITNLTGPGSFTASGTAPLTITGPNTISGPVTIATSATLLVGSASALGTGSVTNNGILEPTASNQTIDIGGAFTQSSTGTTILTINSATSYDKIVVAAKSGTTLNGTVQINFANGYSPAVGTTFSILTVAGGSINIAGLTAPGFTFSVTGSTLIAKVATASPSPTPTASVTPTPTPTVVPTKTPTPSPTPTVAPTKTPTPSPTPTVAPTKTPTPSPTPTVAPTKTPTPSPTPTVAPTKTPTPSPTPTVAPTKTPTPSPTPTVAPTKTPTPSPTPTVAPTKTPTPSPTPTVAPTKTPTPSPTPTVAPTKTPTPSPTPTAAQTKTPTPSPKRGGHQLTPTPGSTQIVTPTLTPTPTVAPLPTPTPTPTFAPTNTPTPSPTPAIAPTATPTPTRNRGGHQIPPSPTPVSTEWEYLLGLVSR